MIDALRLVNPLEGTGMEALSRRGESALLGRERKGPAKQTAPLREEGARRGLRETVERER